MPTNFTRFIALLCAISLLASLQACSSIRVVADRGSTPDIGAADLRQLVQPNDSVVITTQDGRRLALRITASSAEAIEGVPDGSTGSVRLAGDSIARIERREPDVGKTSLLIVAIAAGIYLVVQAATAAAGAQLLSGL